MDKVDFTYGGDRRHLHHHCIVLSSDPIVTELIKLYDITVRYHIRYSRFLMLWIFVEKLSLRNEIDESKFGSKIYNKVLRVENQWVFGGYERGSAATFMTPLEKRDKSTLLPGYCQEQPFIQTFDMLDDEWYNHLRCDLSIKSISRDSFGDISINKNLEHSRSRDSHVVTPNL